MEPQEPLVLFCDLCNASVPVQDVEAGRAVRHQNRTFGACCLPALRPAAAAAGPAATPSVAVTPGQGPVLHRAGTDRLLPLGVVLLAATAAGALFLDARIDELDGRLADAQLELGKASAQQTEDVQGLLRVVDSLARRGDLDGLQQRLLASEERDAREQQVRQDAGKQADLFVAEIRTALKLLQEGMQQRDPGPAIAELRVQLQQQAVALAELRARPAAREPAPVVDAEAPMPAPGLGPSLQHQIAKLKDEDAATRFEAVDELLRTKDPAVLEFLLPMAKDPDTFVRRLCVEGFRDFHRREVVDALLVALADPEEIVRDQAWRSLKDLTGQKLPFEAGASRDARARAQQKWQEWWDKNRDGFGA